MSINRVAHFFHGISGQRSPEGNATVRPKPTTIAASAQSEQSSFSGKARAAGQAVAFWLRKKVPNSSTPSSGDTTQVLSRRALLRGAAGAMAAGALSSCTSAPDRTPKTEAEVLKLFLGDDPLQSRPAKMYEAWMGKDENRYKHEGYETRFIDLHMQILNAYDDFRKSQGFPPVAPWDPTTPIPDHLTHEHPIRESRPDARLYQPVPKPVWLGGEATQEALDLFGAVGRTQPWPFNGNEELCRQLKDYLEQTTPGKFNGSEDLYGQLMDYLNQTVPGQLNGSEELHRQLMDYLEQTVPGQFNGSEELHRQLMDYLEQMTPGQFEGIEEQCTARKDDVGYTKLEQFGSREELFRALMTYYGIVHDRVGGDMAITPDGKDWNADHPPAAISDPLSYALDRYLINQALGYIEHKH